MIIDRIVISASPGEIRIAELSGGKLAGLTLDRDESKSLVGSIYLGRVEAVIDGLQAAFIEIGEARSGFLALPEVRPCSRPDTDNDIGDYLSEGDLVLVQVLRDPEEDKGAKLTMRIGLSGRDLVFLPGGRGFSISRRISDNDDRRRLNVLMDVVSGDGGGGFIVRTAAVDAEEKDLGAEAERLRRGWSEIMLLREKANAPARLFQDVELACRALREHGGPDLQSIIVDDAELLVRMCAFAEIEAPDLLDIIKRYAGAEPLFVAEGIEEMIDGALDPYVPLASGGNIVISEMPALTAIDVNAGSADYGSREHTAFEVNKEAAREIAKQIRLRNLSGTLVIDFISMRRHENRQDLCGGFRQSLAGDPMHPSFIGLTRLGLAEMTRRRQSGSLFELICERSVQPELSVTSTALAALRAVLRHATLNRAAGYVIEAHADVISVLEFHHVKAYRDTRERLGGSLDLVAVDGTARSYFEVHSSGK